MINQMTRILTRWLEEHPVYGVPVLLASAVFDSSAEQTALEIKTAQLPLTIYNDVDDECVAKRYEPDEVPALVIIGELANDAPVHYGRGQLDYPSVGASFAYLERDEPVNYARQRGGYVLRAVQDSLLAFNVPAVSKVALAGTESFYAADDTWRSLNGVEIIEVTDVRENRVTGGLGKSTLIGTMLGTFKVRRRVVARY